MKQIHACQLEKLQKGPKKQDTKYINIYSPKTIEIKYFYHTCFLDSNVNPTTFNEIS